MKNKNKVLIATGIMTMLAVGGVAIGTTTALFKKETLSNVHINAGNLDVGFYLKEMKVDMLNSDGTYDLDHEVQLDSTEPYKNYWDTEKEMVDLGPEGYQGDFQIDDFVPSMRGSLTFVVENYSKVAIEVWMDGTTSGKFNGNVDMDEDEVLALQTEVPWSIDEPVVLDAAGNGESSKAEGTLTFLFDPDAGNEYELCTFTINSIITAQQISAR